MLKKIKFDKILLLMLLGGLVLRLVGITHGFPFIFHPDEPALIRGALGLRFELNPKHFDWPHLHFYLNFILYWVFIKLRGLLQIANLQETLSGAFPLLWRDPLVFYFLSRIFNVFLGVLTAVPIFFATKNLFNKTAGYLAAALFLIIPHHVHTSAFALIDVPTAFWTACAFYFSTKIYKSNELKNYLWAGFFIGLAASTKYNGGLLAIMIPIAHFFRTFKSTHEKVFDFAGIKLLVLSGLLAIFGFILGTPYALLDYGTFSRTDSPVGAYWQFSNVGKVGFSEQVIQFFDNLTFDAFEDYGYSILILYWLAIFYGIFVKREKSLWVILIPSLLFIFYISGFQKTRSHYYISAYPLIASAAGYIVWLFLQKIKNQAKYLFLFVVFLPPLYFSINNAKLLATMDTRVELYNWMIPNITSSDHIYYNSTHIQEVIEKFTDFNTDKLKENVVLSDSGFIILSFDDTELMEFNFGMGIDYQKVYALKKVLEISGQDRDGNHIMVYEYGKN